MSIAAFDPNELPRITFGMIVLNGQPFIRYNLRALYPFAHEIVVVEGASPHAASIATADGHSVDGTLDTLWSFKRTEDPEGKLQIVIAEDEGFPNGFWPGEKDQQCQAFAKRATGNWLWQVDVDEFYLPKHIEWIQQNILTNPNVWAVSFEQRQFFAGLQYYVDGWFLRCYFPDVNRLFRWGKGFQYASHRPVIVRDDCGVDLRLLGWIRGSELARRGIRMLHYSLVFPGQVNLKSQYYNNVTWGQFNKMMDWANHSYDRLERPYRVHNTYQYPSWLERYQGEHPPQILQMWQDIQNGQTEQVIELRANEDIELLLSSWSYRFGRFFLKLGGNLLFWIKRAKGYALRILPLSLKNRPLLCLVSKNENTSN